MSEDQMTTEKVIYEVENQSDIDLGFEEEDPNETPEQKKIRKLTRRCKSNKEWNTRLLMKLKEEREEKIKAHKEAQEMCDEIRRLRAEIDAVLQRFKKYNKKSTVL